MSMPGVNSLFAGRSLFLTGGTGFVVIEKFLRAVPNIHRIFVLVRSSRGKSANERWAAISNTSVVIHCAATVRFNDKLRSAIEFNVKGVQRMIRLCKRMPRLESFLHCSTCYVNVEREGEIEEKQYPIECDPYNLIESWMSDSMLEGITNSITSKYFNTYCFTKHAGEELIRRECEHLPVLIFRPSIIGGIWKDGIPGWADSIQGINAVAFGFATGTVPRMPCERMNPADVVPVDVVSNMIIVSAAYRLHLTAQKVRSMPILHCSSSHLNPFIIDHFVNVGGTFYNEYPMERMLFAPTTGTRGIPAFEDSLHAFKHNVVGRCMDKVGEMMNKKPFWERTFIKTREVYQVFIPFVSKKWIFKTGNMVELIEKMHPDDVKKFDFDVRRIDWTAYCSDFLFGLKTFLAKNDIMNDEKMGKARSSAKMYEIAKCIVSAWSRDTRKSSAWLVDISADNRLFLFMGHCSDFRILSLYYYLNCGMYKRVQIGSIEDYRERLSDAMKLSNKQKSG